MTEPTTFQATVGQWAEATFPQATTLSIVNHLRREALEAYLAGIDLYVNQDAWRDLQNVADLLSYDPAPAIARLADELADMVLLAYHLAHRLNVDLDEAVRAKFAVNQGRSWGPPDAEGVSEHVVPATAE